MKDLKQVYELMNYQVNSLVLKSIKSLNIDLNDFILLLYFMNKELVLDIPVIKECTGLNEEEILTSYSNLLSKGLLEIKTKKIGGRLEEVISLDMLYDKLILNKEEDKPKNTDIYSKFENEFGRTLSPIEYETITGWVSNGVSEELITSALKEAVMNGVFNLRYIDKIIYEWNKKGSPLIRDEEEYKELFDYNWLEDDIFDD